MRSMNTFSRPLNFTTRMLRNTSLVTFILISFSNKYAGAIPIFFLEKKINGNINNIIKATAISDETPKSNITNINGVRMLIGRRV